MIGFVYDRDEASRILHAASEEYEAAAQRSVNLHARAKRLLARHAELTRAYVVGVLGWPDDRRRGSTP